MTYTKQEQLYLTAKEKYYKGHPIMSDAEFDYIEDALKIEGSDVPFIVGFENRNLKFPHFTPMLSLSKYQTNKITGEPPTNSAITWMKSRIIGEQVHFEWTPKFDGNAANIKYKNGKLLMAVSRGNGILGRDITKKLYQQLPKTISIKGNVEIRGEVVMARDTFKQKYAKEFANERNIVAGILNKDVTLHTKDRLCDIIFIALDIKKIDENNITHIDSDKLEALGFNKKYKLEKHWVHYNDFEKSFYKMKEYRENKCPFLLDGFVIKVAAKYRNKFGENMHDPNWAIAIKFSPKTAITELINIKWNFSKTGEMIPIAILKPVDLDGTIIKRASLYNAGFIIKNNVLPGSQVKIVKAGDIIPQIIGVIS